MPRNSHLVNAIFNEPWLISIVNHRDQINALLGGVLSSNIEMEDISQEPTEISGSVAVISIAGVLIKSRGACGEPGMEDYGRQITEAINDNAIDAIVLKIYSPGGMVNGTDNLASIIKESKKPIVAFIDDQACSGAYWIASACQNIIANNDIATIGSIGVMAIYNDLRKANEKAGVAEHLVFARQSPDKWREYLEVCEGKYDIAKEHLSVIADHFLAHIRTQRPTVTDDLMTGSVYFAKDVVGTLIDSIGGLDTAVEYALSLAKNLTNNPKETMKQPKTTALAAAAAVTAFEMADDQISLNRDQIEALENTLEIAATQATALNAAQTRIAELEAVEATAAATIATQTARIAELEAAPGADSAQSTPPLDGQPQAADSQLDFMTAMASARTYLKK